MNHMYTLWRGHELLGRINPELPGDVDNGVGGVLDTAGSTAVIQEIHQHGMPGIPGAPVFQHVRSSSDSSSDGGDHNTFGVASTPMNRGMPAGTPVEQQLSLKDATGAVVTTHTISIMPMPRASSGVQQRCNEAGVTFSGWMVIAGFDSHPGHERRSHSDIGERH